MAGVSDGNLIDREYLDELEVEKRKAYQDEPNPNELAMLVAALGNGDATLVTDIDENKESLQRRFALARRLFKAARWHLRDRPLPEQRQSEQTTIDRTLKLLPGLNDRGEAVFSFKQLLKEAAVPDEDRKKGTTMLGSITTRTGLLAAIKRNFSQAEARRIIRAESLTGKQLNALMKDPKRRRPRSA